MMDLINVKVKHAGALGVGTVIDQEKGRVTVQFPTKTCKFLYPSAFEKFITPEDIDIANAIAAEIKADKEAAEAAKAAKEAEEAAKEQARIEALQAKTVPKEKKGAVQKKAMYP